MNRIIVTIVFLFVATGGAIAYTLRPVPAVASVTQPAAITLAKSDGPACVAWVGGDHCVTKFQDGPVTCYAVGWSQPAISCVVEPQ